jgi:hypothetical protein
MRRINFMYLLLLYKIVILIRTMHYRLTCNILSLNERDLINIFKRLMIRFRSLLKHLIQNYRQTPLDSCPRNECFPGVTFMVPFKSMLDIPKSYNNYL